MLRWPVEKLKGLDMNKFHMFLILAGLFVIAQIVWDMVVKGII